MSKRILIFGAGSVGKRHGRNLSAMGCQASFVDPSHDRAVAARNEVDGEGAYAATQEAFDEGKFDGVVVGSPTAYHVDQAVAAIERGLPVLLEKPVSVGEDEARALEKCVHDNDGRLLLGYTWRWWPALRTMKEMLGEGRIGTPYSVRMVMSAHLADWHPWERYQDWFMSNKEQGGGALLDESHWIDQALWLFGLPSRVYGRVEKISRLEMDADDNVDMLLVYDSGLRVVIHLDLYGRPHERSVKVLGEHGSMDWQVNELSVYSSAEDSTEQINFPEDRNAMFENVASEFMEVMDGKTAPSCTISDGVQVMCIIEAVRESQDKGVLVDMAW